MTRDIVFKNDNALNCYNDWPSPTLVILDGPYGINGFEGDTSSPDKLPQWYDEHIKRITRKSTPETTLWFWCTEIGWAFMHPIFEKYGWEYKCCNIWNKGIGHIAGNSNSKTLSKLPVVTEVCVQYVKKPSFIFDEKEVSMKDWLYYEWKRTGLPLSKTNDACGVKNAASRKYFDRGNLWYMPTPESFEKLVKYANLHGNQDGKPYFSFNEIENPTSDDWKKMRAKFYCPIGITNVWNIPSLRSSERIKKGTKAAHNNQKPLEIIKMLLEISSDEGDIVWDPFGGLGTTVVAAIELKRKIYSCEISKETYDIAMQRIDSIL